MQLAMSAYGESPQQVVLNTVARRWPNFVFTMSRDHETMKNAIDVWKQEDPGTNLPPIGVRPVVSVEFDGFEEKDIELLMVKLTMVCG